jgi:hypothetical protein
MGVWSKAQLWLWANAQGEAKQIGGAFFASTFLIPSNKLWDSHVLLRRLPAFARQPDADT